jgi:hypothetical protein
LSGSFRASATATAFLAISGQRANKIALRHQHVAELDVDDPEIELESGAARIGGQQVLQDAMGMFYRGECALGVAAGQERRRCLDQSLHFVAE